jgi:CRISPR/Cas system-associated endonuclease Cas1
MMEEFRSTLVDTTCWWLVREFSGEWWIPSSQGARLGEDARLRLIARLERRFGAMTLHQPTGQRVTIRRAIELQVRGFAALLQGGRRPFGPIRT